MDNIKSVHHVLFVRSGSAILGSIQWAFTVQRIDD